MRDACCGRWGPAERVNPRPSGGGKWKRKDALDTLINRVDEQIRVIKSLSPTSFTLDNLYDELAVMAIIRALPHSFDDVVQTISVLDKFDKQSVVQSLRNMDYTHANLFSTTSAFAASSAPSKCSQHVPTSPAPSSSSLSYRIGPLIALNVTSALALAI